MRFTLRLLPTLLTKITACTALLTVVSGVGLPLSWAKAQELPPMPIQFNPETLRSPGRPGGRRRGGGSRGECATGDIPLSAIAYAESQSTRALGVDVIEESVGSFTTQAQPLLWFYMPEAISEDRGATLMVQNERGEVVYEGRLAGATEDNGIISVPLAVEMAPESAYRWILSLDCGDTASESVSGWIARQSPGSTASRLLAQAEPRNRVALYANYGYVQDALSELAMLRLADRDNEELAQNWVGFLSGLGLEDLTAAPMLDCCELAGIEPEEREVDEVDEAMEPEVELETEPVEVEENAEPRESVIERVRRRGRSPLNR